MANTENPGLDNAYAVQGPDENIQLYQRWSSTYDSEFAEPRGYVYPQRIAEQYYANNEQHSEPILDVGAGTGLVGAAIKERGNPQIDGIDISQEMLDQAAVKNIYRRLMVADLTQTLDIENDVYGAVVSAGTFTHGHVGPDAILELLRIAKPGALFCLGINGTAFDKYGFGSAIAGLSADGLIETLRFSRVVYYEKANDEHADDQGFTALFVKAHH